MQEGGDHVQEGREAAATLAVVVLCHLLCCANGIAAGRNGSCSSVAVLASIAMQSVGSQSRVR